ncbi:S24 family peptidase [Lactococcus muris]|uniref:S24 family peptidase n=1 Tax=Lactococcus muris TaxID=2941330 RepID=A0ABV4D909_9LACT
MRKIRLPEMIDYFRKENGWTMKEFGEKLNKSESAISKWIKGVRSPMVEDFDKMVKLFNTDPDILMYGVSEASTTLDKITNISSKLKESRQQVVLDTAENELEEQQKENISKIREFIYNYYDNAVSAGTGEYLTDGKPETVTLPVDFDADFVCPISGDSMEPEYHDGDYVFVKLSYDISDGDIGVFILDGDAYIKELRVDEEGAFLHSLNPQYRDKPITAESNFRIVGEVVGRYNEKD